MNLHFPEKKGNHAVPIVGSYKGKGLIGINCWKINNQTPFFVIPFHLEPEIWVNQITLG